MGRGKEKQQIPLTHDLFIVLDSSDHLLFWGEDFLHWLIKLCIEGKHSMVSAAQGAVETGGFFTFT